MKSFFARHKLFIYGQTIPDLYINGIAAPYPVVNERAVRAGAGMMFALGFFAFFHAWYLAEYIYLQIFVSLFFFDFFMKVVVGTVYSPIGWLANLVVQKQTPEYVGAIQKRFAWSIGLFLSTLMLVLIFGFGIIGPINLAICAVCLTFMFMESAFGICVGCKMYSFFIKYKVLPTPAVRPVCPGNVCAIE